MTRSREAWISFLATRVVGIVVDAAVIGLAYLSAFALRFDFQEPTSLGGWITVARSYVVVCAVHLASLLLFGCYRLAWRRVRGSELPQYIGAMMFACGVLTLMRYFLPNVTLSHIRPPAERPARKICFMPNSSAALLMTAPASADQSSYQLSGAWNARTYAPPNFS